MIRLPHRWCNIALISVACIIIYSAFQYIKRPLNDDDYIIKRKSVKTSTEEESRTFFSKNSNNHISKRIYGIGNFDSRLPKLQHDFDEESRYDRMIRESRRLAIRNSFLHGWNGYKTYALGADELKPLSNEAHNPFGGMGATMVDSLSTMLVMELDSEFDEMLPLIEKIQVKVDEDLSVFETIIRYMGGLLSAYELSNHPGKKILLDKAEEIGLALLPAFDTAYGLPHYKFNPVTGESPNNFTYLADAGTVQLEFFTLSHHTGNPIFAEKAQAITDFMDTAEYTHGVAIPGLYPFDINIAEGYFRNSAVSFGAMGDSAYEYFLKEYILTDGQVPQFARMYQQSIDSMKFHMLQQLPGSKFLYLPAYDTSSKTKMGSMDHLTCFVPGMLAMGSKIFNRPDDMVVAKGLLETCVHMYRSSRTNLSPEMWGIGEDAVPYNPLTYGKSEEELAESHRWWIWTGRPRFPRPKVQAEVPNTKNRTLVEPVETPSGIVTYDPRYLLRPETVESLYVLYRVTGDPIYQEYGWVIYEALEKHCKTANAYASIKNVRIIKKRPVFNQIDSMETFLFSETFKYLYLLFSPPEVISLDKFVLNTEAHPLLRRPWSIDLSK